MRTGWSLLFEDSRPQMFFSRPLSNRVVSHSTGLCDDNCSSWKTKNIAKPHEHHTFWIYLSWRCNAYFLASSSCRNSVVLLFVFLRFALTCFCFWLFQRRLRTKSFCHVYVFSYVWKRYKSPHQIINWCCMEIMIFIVRPHNDHYIWEWVLTSRIPFNPKEVEFIALTS